MSETKELKERWETADDIVECSKFDLGQEGYLECLSSFVPPKDAPDYSDQSRIIGWSLIGIIIVSTLIALVAVYKKRWRQDRHEKYGMQFKRTAS